MNKIYITAIIRKDGNVFGMAVAETGEILAEVLSPSTYWAHFDLGVDSNKNHDIYEARYPNGYKLEIVDSFEKHEGIRAAFQRVFTQFQQAYKVSGHALANP